MNAPFARRTLLAATAAGVAAAALGGTETARAARPVFSTKPAVDAVRRVAGRRAAAQIHFRAVRADEEYFRISGERGRPVIEGTSPVVLLTGFNWYLKYVLAADVSWDAAQVDLPNPLPAPRTEIRQRANAGRRLFGNDIWTDYTGPHWTFEDWEREIDILALQGYNAIFMPVGMEDVAHRMLQEFGYSRAEALAWTAPAAHRAAGMWQGGWTLEDGGISEADQQRRVKLGQRIAERMRALGMKPLVPGFVGFVPEDFAERNPGAEVADRGYWFTQRMLSWLNPDSAPYREAAARFYAIQRELFGEFELFAMNPFTEGGRSPYPLDIAGRAIQETLQANVPGGIWQMHGWQENPKSEMLTHLDPKTTWIVDFVSDRYSGLDREKTWGGIPYAFGPVWNYGGHTTMGANLGVWNTRYHEWRNKPGSSLDGIALSPEGGHGDVLPLQFFAELAWRDEPVDLDQWMADYATRRYGASDQNATRAWQAMGRTAYRMPADGWHEAQDGLFAARPALDVRTAAEWSPKSIRYDAGEFATALPALLAVAPALRDSDTYRLDLMSVARQVLDNNSRALLPRIRSAYRDGDLDTFNELTASWLDQMRLQDDLVGTIRGFQLGPWIAQARASAGDAGEEDRYVYDYKEMLTLWGNDALADGGLNDYCNRGWQDLIGTFYLPRWERYFATLRTALESGSEPERIDWNAMERAWVADVDRDFAMTPSGETYALAKRVESEW